MNSLIQFAMCGSGGEECNPYDITAPIERQRLLLLINSKSLSIEDIAKELDISIDNVTKLINELVRCGLVKEINGLYKPTFAIFTLNDQRILQPLIDSIVQDVVDIVRDNMEDVRRVINNLTIVKRGLRFPDLEYIVVGAITLDYEGLDILSEEGLLIKSKKMPGGEYIFAGFEVGLIDLEKAWMWGHTGTFGRYYFSTHGKLPPKGIRLAFPDLAWLWYAQGIGPNDIESKMIEIGDILNTLLQGDLGFKDLRDLLGIEETNLIMDLSLLLTLKYIVVIDKELWRLNIPAFTQNDYDNIKSLSESILRIIAKRFKSKLSIIRNYYSKTLPAKNDIPLEEAFNQIYHLVFEKALNSLIKDNVIKEPPLKLDNGKYSSFMIVLE